MANSDSKKIALRLMALNPPTVWEYCCRWREEHGVLDIDGMRIFVACIEHVDFALFRALYEEQRRIEFTPAFINTISRVLIEAHRPIEFLEYHSRVALAYDWCLWQYAAQFDNIEVMQWLLDANTGNGVSYWNARSCDIAAAHGNIRALRLLRTPVESPIQRTFHTGSVEYTYDEHGVVHVVDGGRCPWDAQTCLFAVQRGHLRVLQWLLNAGTGGGSCPWDPAECLAEAQKNGDKEMTAWIAQYHQHM